MKISIFNAGLGEEEMALAMPDLAEAKSLPRHVERCAQRFKLLARGQAALGRTQIALMGMAVYLVAVSEPARNMIKALAGFF